MKKLLFRVPGIHKGPGSPKNFLIFQSRLFPHDYSFKVGNLNHSKLEAMILIVFDFQGIPEPLNIKDPV